MKTSFPIAIAAALALSFGVAQARETLSVRLEAPMPQKGQVIADRMLFNCAGNQCAAVLRAKLSVRTCRELAKEVGPIASFGSGSTSLNDEELARCNAVAKTVSLPETVQAAND